MPTRYDHYGSLDIESILQGLSVCSTGSQEGKDNLAFLQNLLTVRVAHSMVIALNGSAEATGKSANAVKQTLENSSEWLINAIKSVQRTAPRTPPR